MPQIILASQSPRRKALLAQMGVAFKVVPSNFDEYLNDDRAPETVAIELALGKALTVAEEYPDSIVIGSDTIATIDGTQLGKPRDAAEARTMLKLLSGTHNEVTTGVAVVCRTEGTQLTGADTAHVYFKPYDAEAVAKYVETGDPLDKAGAYGIQSGAAPLIDHIDGNYDAIVGLPTQLLASLLAKLGVEAKAVRLTSPVPQK